VSFALVSSGSTYLLDISLFDCVEYWYDTKSQKSYIPGIFIVFVLQLTILRNLQFHPIMKYSNIHEDLL
jgi:hypothetical protein